MLILTRRIGESLAIGDDITITIMGLNGQQVRVGVSAPSSVRIFRTELLGPREGDASTDSTVGGPAKGD